MFCRLVARFVSFDLSGFTSARDRQRQIRALQHIMYRSIHIERKRTHASSELLIDRVTAVVGGAFLFWQRCFQAERAAVKLYTV